MTISRRKFIKTGVLGGLGASALSSLSLSDVFAAESHKPSAPIVCQTLAEAFAALRFDPTDGASAFFAVTSDIHYIKDAPGGFKEVVPDLNAIRPQPAFLAILGDNICSLSPSFGSKPNYPQANREIAELKEDLAKLNPDLKTYLLAGNHDTFPYEQDAAYFCGQMNREPYYSFDKSGIHFVFLNGAHDGSIDEKQKQWLAKTIRSFDSRSTVVLGMHQPLGEANERGLTMILPEIFDQFSGELWLLCGHGHVNQVRAFQLPKTVLREVEVASCVGGWNHSGANYWIFCIQNGHITGKIDRIVGKSWTVAPEVSIQSPRTLRQPFESVKDEILVSALMGPGSELEIIDGKGGDCGTFWFYLTTITASLPLPKGQKASRLAILGSLNSPFNGAKPAETKRHVYASGDGSSWTELHFSEKPEPGQVWIFPLPDCIVGERLFFKIDSFGYKANDTIAGAALLK